MSPVVPRRPGAPSASSPAMMALVVGGSIVAVMLLLIALGVVDMSRLFGPAAPSTEGLIAVPTPAAPIRAYTRIRRDHLWDRRNSRLAVIYLPPSAVSKEMLVNISDVIGRVLESDKEPGYVFTESDFLPRGTREGIVAGIPAGKRAIRVSADRVDGLFGLNAGDRFDILATMPIDATSGGQSFNVAGPYSQEVQLQAQLSNWDKQATVRVIVQNASIVEPMTTRGVTLTQQSVAEGGAARTRPLQETVIAIEPDEVALLTEAMAVNARLTTIPRSGRPGDPVNSKTPELRPFSPFMAPGERVSGDASRLTTEGGESFRMVETIMGQKRSLTAVPRP